MTAAAAVDIARRARAAAGQVPAVPPMGGWSVQVGESRYELARQDLAPAPERGRAGTAHSAEWKSVKPPTPVLTADLNGAVRLRDIQQIWDGRLERRPTGSGGPARKPKR